MSRCVVTWSDSGAYEAFLVPFLASLFDVAKWDGPIFVFDYGLAETQRKRLEQAGVQLAEPFKKQPLTTDRYASLARFAAEREGGAYGAWDADVWFCGPIDPLFEEAERGELVCCPDVLFQPAIYSACAPGFRDRCQRALEANVRRYGNPLQAGFLAGWGEAVAAFSGYISARIAAGDLLDNWWADSAALNCYAHEFPQRLRVLDPVYNCLPLLRPEKEGSRFLLPKGYLVRDIYDKCLFLPVQRQLVRAIHIAGPLRVDALKEYTFRHNYPGLLEEWLKRLA